MRNVSKDKYLVAGAITFGVFLLGLFLGLVIEGQRVEMIKDLYALNKVEFSSSQLQYDYFNSLQDNEACPVMFKAFDANLESLDNARIKLDNYARNSKLSDEQFDLLKRQYQIEQLKYWMLTKSARTVCNQSLVRILYFYSTEEDCPKCSNQEFILNYLRSRYKENLLIFAIDSQFTQEPFIPLLLQRYNVSIYPSLVVEDNTMHGFTDKDDILSELCILDHEHFECENAPQDY